MAQQNRAKSPSPKAIGWTLSFLSFALLTAACCLIAIHFDRLRKASAHKRLLESFSQDEWDGGKIERYLQILNQKPPMHSWFKASSGLQGQAESQLIKDLSATLGLIRNDQVDLAVAKGLASIPNLLNDERPEYSNLLSSQAYRALLTELRDLAVEYSKLRRQESSNEKEIARNREEIRRTVQKHSLVANDFADFFSLMPDLDPSGTALTTYQHGYLRDLPRLRGLRDNIEDAVTLRAELDGAGGSVKISGDNPHAVFTAKLKGLAQLSRQLASDCEALKGEISRLETENKRTDEILSKGISKIERALIAMLGAMTAPR